MSFFFFFFFNFGFFDLNVELSDILCGFCYFGVNLMFWFDLSIAWSREIC